MSPEEIQVHPVICTIQQWKNLFLNSLNLILNRNTNESTKLRGNYTFRVLIVFNYHSTHIVYNGQFKATKHLISTSKDNVVYVGLQVQFYFKYIRII